MHAEIKKLLDLALSDGQITEKEKEIILRKAEKLGLDIDEIEMIVEGFISKTKNDSDLNDFNTNSHQIEISDSYIEKEDLNNILENISNFEKKIIEVEQFYLENFHEWVNKDFLEIIKNHPKKMSLEELKFFMKKNSIWSRNVSFKESRISDFLNKILTQEKFIGYFAIKFDLLSADERKKNSEILNDNCRTLLFTNKNIYYFDDNPCDIVNNRFICSSVELQKVKSPEIYDLKIYNCSTGKVIYALNFDSPDCDHSEIMKKNGIERTEKCFKLDFLGELNHDYFSFLHMFSLNHINKISFDKIINNFSTNFNFTSFKNIIKNSQLLPDQISNLQKINNYIENFLSNFNCFIAGNKTNILYYDDLGPNEDFSFNEKSFFTTLGRQVFSPKFNQNLEDILNYYKNTMIHTIVILDLRDKLLNCYLRKDFVEANEVLLKIDNYGVFLTKYERSSIEKLEEINISLNKLNNTLIEGFSMVSDAIDSLNYSLNDMKNSINNLESTVDIGNFIQMVQTYQMYKINTNTKQLRG